MGIEKFLQLARLKARHPNRTGQLLRAIQEGERYRIAKAREQSEYEESQKDFLGALRDLLTTPNLQIPDESGEEHVLYTAPDTYRRGTGIRITAERLTDGSVCIHNHHTYYIADRSTSRLETIHLDANMDHVTGIVLDHFGGSQFPPVQNPALTNQIYALSSTAYYLRCAKENMRVLHTEHHLNIPNPKL